VPRHDLDVLSLLAGVVAAGSAIVFLVDRSSVLPARWAWPVLLIIIGVAGLIASRRGNSRRPDSRRDEVP
jgi:hypothetical protein